MIDALVWIEEEMEYATTKRGDRRQEDIANLAHHASTPMLSIFWRDVEMYAKRAGTLGLDNPLGRQALGKAVAVAVAMLEAVAEEFGDLGIPGIPSGHAED